MTLELGKGRFALYAHGQLGAPYLHLQLIDANSPMDAKGIPELETFTQLGMPDGPNALHDGQPWQSQGSGETRNSSAGVPC